MKIFAKRLIELRNQNKYTQRFMAEKLGISQPSYIRYEQDTAEPTYEKLVLIADLFDVSADYLLGRTNY
ncbi:MAG: helix-turn-helix domain-containing protein [Firmicutes bacterium]|nr:helix-turn-helix domain-containing protein [Bacillota bacterium]